MPAASLVFAIVLITMVLFYATSFDSIAYTAACYSYKSLDENEKPHWAIQLLWCVLLILLPIALVFAESSINSLQSLSIVSAFPLGIIMILIVVSFVLDSKKEIDYDSQIGFIRDKKQSSCWSCLATLQQIGGNGTVYAHSLATSGFVPIDMRQCGEHHK